jgi:hypothetical protein
LCLLPSSLILNEQNAANFILKKLAADKHVNLFSFDMSDKEKVLYPGRLAWGHRTCLQCLRGLQRPRLLESR